MKKILIGLIALISFSQSFGQSAGNDTTKYAYYKFTYGNALDRYWARRVLIIPADTIYSKDGLAMKNGTLYVGNGTSWSQVTGGGGGIDSAVIGSNGVIVSVAGSVRNAKADTFFVATRSRLQKVTDSMNAVNLTRFLQWADSVGTNAYTTFDRSRKIADSLGVLLGNKVTNGGSVAILQHVATYAGRPTVGIGLFYADDSAAFYSFNGSTAVNLTGFYNVAFLGKGVGDTSYVYGRGQNILVAGINDSLDFKHYTRGDTARTFYVQAHDSTSGNALQTKYRSDTARNNIYNGLGAKGGAVHTDPTTGLLTTQPAILHAPGTLATAAALPANTYNNGTSGFGATLTANSNGALTVDGVAAALGNRILVKNEAAPSHNGIYTVSQAGSVSTPYILTRGLYSSLAPNMGAGSFIYIQAGTANTNTVWYQQTTGTITFGTSPLAYAQTAGSGGSLPTIGHYQVRGQLGGSDTVVQYITYNVRDFGIVDDGTTDNLAAVRALAVWLPDGAALYWPGGGAGYVISDSVIWKKNIRMFGDGMKPFKIFTVNLTPFHGATNILFTSATADGFVFATNGSTNQYPIYTIDDMSFINTAGSTPTAGAGLKFNGSKQGNLHRVEVENFFIDVLNNSNNLVAHDCFFINPVLYGMEITSALNPDAGGTELSYCHFASGFNATTTAKGIYWKGGGLLYLDYCDFNAQAILTSNTEFVADIYSDLTDGPTSDCRITNCEFENFQTSAIVLTNQSGGRFYNVQIIGNQFGAYSTAPDAAIIVNGFYIVQIDHNIGATTGPVIQHPLIRLIGDTTVQLGMNLPKSRIGTQSGWLCADSVYTSEDIQRTVIASSIPSVAALGPNILGIITNPNGQAADSMIVQLPTSLFTPTTTTFNNLTSFANGGNFSGFVLQLGSATATNPGIVSTGTQTYAGPKIFTSAISTDNIVVGSGGTAGANIAIGNSSLIPATATGTNNHGIGTGSLHSLTSGAGNMANGPSSLAACTTCSFNVAEGSSALTASNTSDNTAVGYQTMVANNTGGDVTAIGFKALNASTAQQNTAVGSKAAIAASTAASLTAIGYGALSSVTTGGFCTALGAGAMPLNISGTHSMALGYDAGWFETRSNKFIVGDNTTTYLIGGDFSTGQLCFNCNTTGTNLFALTASALVEMRGTTGGFLPPVLTTTQQNAISSPATGLTIWNSDSLTFVCYNGTAWLKLGYAFAAGGGGSNYQTVQNNASSMTVRPKLNFTGAPNVSDNSGNTSTDVHLPGLMFSQTANGTAVTNTTTQTTLLGTGTGTMTFAANTLVAGEVIVVHGYALLSTASSGVGSLSFELLNGFTGVSLSTSPTTSLSGQTAEITATATILTTGSSGTMVVAYNINLGGTSTPILAAGSGSYAINTTISRTFDLQVTWANALSANSIQSVAPFTMKVE